MAPRILSISNDTTLLQTRELLLEQEGCSVVSTQLLEETLQLCTNQSFDLVIIGHSLPQEPKERFLAALRRLCSTPVLALVRPGEQEVADADYNLDSTAGPVTFAEKVKEIVFRDREVESQSAAD